MIKPFMRFDKSTGKWYARTHRGPVNNFMTAAVCPFVAYMGWVEGSLRVGCGPVFMESSDTMKGPARTFIDFKGLLA